MIPPPVQPLPSEPYRALYDRLVGVEAPAVHMTFEEIEGLVGCLPEAARRRRQWWTNITLSPQGRSWLYAGWKVARADLAQGTVSFRRVAG